MSSIAAIEVLAEPTRRQILDLLRDGERSVGDLVGDMRATQPPGDEQRPRLAHDAALLGQVDVQDVDPPGEQPDDGADYARDADRQAGHRRIVDEGRDRRDAHPGLGAIAHQGGDGGHPAPAVRRGEPRADHQNSDRRRHRLSVGALYDGPVTSAPRAGPRYAVRIALHRARLLVRSTRRTVRERRHPARWWLIELGGPTGVRLVPARPDAVDAWLELTRAGQPPADGLAASPLGGRALDRSSWRRACLELRGAARRGVVFPYLVQVDGALVGEALAFVDAGTDAAELVTWLAPNVASDQFPVAVGLLTAHLFAGPDRPSRAVLSIPVADTATADALAAAGFAVEGVLLDPPRPDRAVLVAHRTPR
jgi:hypothetical protein